MSVRLAVFDCDGTLVDGQGAVCEAMETAFAEAGLPTPDRHDIRQIVGLSLPMALRHLVPDAPAEQRAHAVEAYKTAFRSAREAGQVSEPLYPGIADLLRELKADGWALAVATGKSDRGLRACVATHGLTDLFDSLQAADFHPSKPAPEMLLAALDECLAERANSVMIGDTIYDIEMAAAAGVRSIGVGWGYHPPDTLLSAGAVGVANTAAELRTMIDG
ncbi:HAD-IA family hydrolase [Erythrobacter sp. LQ02-29]|uniref:HAD-IA family hydrolase n=1 Tax=Erythrobacter sp. LQ02-29 TaxID=2920384 RepID=UPI001F4D444D|nr:HAD-IA family hydrolase [Erythrobacter sp. LQ02-29]